MFNVILKKSPQKVLFLQYVFNLTAGENGIYNSSSKNNLKREILPTSSGRPSSMFPVVFHAPSP